MKLLTKFDNWFDKYVDYIQYVMLISTITPFQFVYNIYTGIDTQHFFDIASLLIIVVLFLIGLTFLRNRLWLSFFGNTLSLFQWVIIFIGHSF